MIIALDLDGVIFDFDRGVKEILGIQYTSLNKSSKEMTPEEKRMKNFMYGKLGVHGDKGANGAKGSIHEKERSYGKSITGHTHTPEILRNTYIVGTSTTLQLANNVGPSSWLSTNAMLWGDGRVQLINVIGGKYKG